jgi:chromosome partitioning protein
VHKVRRVRGLKAHDINAVGLSKVQVAPSMTHVIAVAQRKGGVGKTTLAIFLAGELQKREKGVAVMDADPQRSACHWAEPGNLRFPVYEIGLADQTITNWVREINRVMADYDYAVVDTAPSARALGAAIAISHTVVVPCTPSGLDLEATVETLEIINQARLRRRGLPRVVLVPNRVDGRTLEGKQVVEELASFGEVVGPTIGDRSAFVRAFSTGCSIGDVADGQIGDHEIQLLCTLVEGTL